MIISFQSGLLLIEDVPEDLPDEITNLLKFDPRLQMWCARACDYSRLIIGSTKSGIPLVDRAREYRQLDDLQLKQKIVPRPHQSEALNSWLAAGSRGVVALPTGSGKTILAIMAIHRMKRSALVLVPTLDLLSQWAIVLERFFDREIGMIGGGSKTVCDITVSTYDSAVLMQDQLGSKFGLLIADECHHLPGKEYRMSAALSIAPFRLGLSATPELPDDKKAVLVDLIGETVCEKHIDELSGNILCPYQVKCLKVPLSDEEFKKYRDARKIYSDFIRRNNINFELPGAWQKFMYLSARSGDGQKAFAAFLEQRSIARNSQAKQEMLWQLLTRHAGERILIFTADNAAAYEIGRRFVLPVLTHHTKTAERKSFLEHFRSGDYPVLVTSQVLNEGVDVPESSVGIIVSGTGSVREHVQRLGRILRCAEGKKQAVLYEIISQATSEESSGDRRRNHRAYRRRW